MSVQSRTIVIITERYPYSGSEGFLYDEFDEINRSFKKVFYFPIAESSEFVISESKNVTIDKSLIHAKENFQRNILTRHPILVLRFFFTELFFSKRWFYIITHLRSFFRQLNHALHLANALKRQVGNLPRNTIYYSVWMNNGALAFSILKYQGVIEKYNFRVNGFDIFDERHPGNYMPFRIVNFKMASKIVVLSLVGLEYLNSKSKFGNKLIVNYSGINENGINPFVQDAEFTIVSCSNLVSLKRVNLIVDALKLLDFNLNWLHFGDGPERMAIENNIKTLPKNIRAKLYGFVTKDEMKQIYLSKPINLFLHVSNTEGLGMAIIEAQSYGIPGLCCAAGGVVDVVNAQTGILMPVEVSAQEIANHISEFRTSPMNTTVFRNMVRNHFRSKFSIDSNFKELMKIFESN